MSLQRPRLPLSLLTVGLALSAPHAFAESSVTLAPVTVSDSWSDGYQPRQAQVAGFGSAPLLDTPASVSVFTEQLLQDRQVRLLSEVLQSDASVGESYAPIGYYENFNVRGFSLDAAHSYKINGQTITGEQNVALENKQQVELLKGLSGLQSGVSEPGGVINYVTKRPEDVRTVTVSGSAEGERYIATDLGGWFGSERQFGLRANLAHEDIRSYVDHADGKRDFASLAFDWQMSPDALLQLDVEYQTREQYSVPGYQLLGGSALPHGIDPKDRLAWQDWAKPVKSDSLNFGGRFEYRFNEAWTGALSASRSRVVIDDYSSFAWGGGGALGNYFSPEGNYDIYDYRSPDDTRRTDEAQATLTGRFDALGVNHELTLGTSAQRRTVDQRPTFNEWRGTGNIYQDTPTVEPAPGTPGHTERRLDSRQYGLFFSDRITFNEQWQTVIGAREGRLDEEAFGEDGSSRRHTRQYELLPNAALIYKPRPDISVYTSYSKGLSAGGVAPWFVENKQDILAPTTSHQIELGIKRDWQRMSFSAALFQLRQAYQYAQPGADDKFHYVQQGQQKNIGLELGASGWVTSDLQINASAAAIRARVKDSGTDAYDDHQALNVPRLRAALQADYSIPGVPGLALLGGMRYSASKYANQEGTVEVGGYTVFDVGSRYRTRIAGYDTVLRLTVDNVFDKRYWRDVGDYLGDNYLFQGAPRTARVSASFSF